MKRLFKHSLLACALTMAVGAQGALAEDQPSDISLSGYMALDVRAFAEDALYDDQKNQRINPSLVLNPEFAYEWNNGDDRIDFVPFARIDVQDQERRHWDIRELKYLHIDDGWDLKLGFDKVFWGVTESRHLVDIINQTDAVEDVDGEDKLGQPMVNLGFQNDWGDVNMFVMPYFRERTFPGKDGRLRAGTVVDTDQVIYEHSAEEFHPDFALRYSTYVGDWDIGLSHFHGTSREPTFVAGTDSSGQSVFIPRYEIIDQTGIDVQATVEEWLWKLESIYRAGHGDSFAAVSAGLEYTFFGAVGDTGDLGVLAEYHWDGRDSDAPSTMHDNDVFFGARLTLNDEDDTDFLAGVLVDRITQAQSFSMEADTRINDQWTIEAELRITNDLATKDPGYGARRDDHIQIRLTRYF
ncbi:hypothetical protein RYZ26_19485 [Terasakiella sp. A23]|uniref:hypothetical protein n=1 Tax=Terasakiella sp. FCG-A23 TaxID=3080561 RepID=UPI002955C405|nr:hypothetical protein [Terasakiella sp. A23]MDV7341792.1 hypothetical protein [Terasakiella sp. A23]